MQMSARSSVAVLVLLAGTGLIGSAIAAEECTSAVACFRFEMGLETAMRGTVLRDAKLGVPSKRTFPRDYGVNVTYMPWPVAGAGLFASIESADAAYHVNVQGKDGDDDCVLNIAASSVAYLELLEQYNGQVCTFTLAGTESSSSAKTFVYTITTTKGSKDTDCGSPVGKCPNQPPQPGGAQQEDSAFIAV